ncbi:MAG: 50S ribosomal protein L21e [Nanoarchaeota archaeon]
MFGSKNARNKGKFKLTDFFQKFKEGDVIAVVREPSFTFSYSKRLQGRTGKVLEKRGSAYYVEIKDLNKPKRYLIRPIHLKRIEVKNK